MVGGPTLIEEECAVTEEGYPLTYDGMGIIEHFFFVSDACDAATMDWANFLRGSSLDWMVIPCVTRSKAFSSI